MTEPYAPAHDGVPASPLARGLLLLAVVLAVTVVVAVVGVPDRGQLEERFDGTGVPGAAVFVLAYAGLSLAPLPKAVLSVAGGVLFGFVGGVLLVLLASVLGAVTAFSLARRLGRDAVERLAGQRLARVDALVRDRGVATMIGLRLVPLVPFTALNYGAGLSAMSLRAFLVGTGIGIVPGTLSYVALGAYGLDLINGWTLGAGAVVTALVVSVLLLRRR